LNLTDIREGYKRQAVYKKTVASTVHFVNRNFANINDIVLMLQAQEYINVPLTERSHWKQYEILELMIFTVIAFKEMINHFMTMNE
jgi:hypothetical protein